VPLVFMYAEEVILTFIRPLYMPSMEKEVEWVSGKITNADHNFILFNNSLLIPKSLVLLAEVMQHGKVPDDPARKTISA
jgi:hypothetical protein